MPHATSAVHLSILLLLLLLLLPFLMLYLPSTDCFFRQRLEVLVIVVQLDSLKGSHCRIFKEAARHTRSSQFQGDSSLWATSARAYDTPHSYRL